MDAIVSDIVPKTARLAEVAPSLGASHNSNRMSGGALGEVARFAASVLPSSLLHPDQSSTLTASLSSKELITMDYHPRTGVVSRHSTRFTVSDFLPQLDVIGNQRRANLVLQALFDDPDKLSPKEQSTQNRLQIALETIFEPHQVPLLPIPENRIQATAVAICEPFKVRVITKGDALPYSESHRLQVQLTSWMKNSPISHYFPALHGPVTHDVLNDLFSSVRSGSTRLFFNSGDYKGATDTLRDDLSRYILRKILSRFADVRDDEYYCKLLEATLCDHTIHYPDPVKRDEELCPPVNQARGQLMGSFLSFPVLNIANLALNLAYLYQWGVVLHPRDGKDNSLLAHQRRSSYLAEILQPDFPEDWADFLPSDYYQTGENVPKPLLPLFHAVKRIPVFHWRSAPLCCNGDDVLICLPVNLFDLGSSVTSQFNPAPNWTAFVLTYGGFVKSVGKNYISDRFCTINSTLFLVDNQLLLSTRKCPRVENFFNDRWFSKWDFSKNSVTGVVKTTPLFGVLEKLPKLGKVKLLSDSDTRYYQVGPQMCGSLIEELQKTSLKPYLALELFLSYHRPRLLKTQRPWFLPADLGGLGIPPTPDTPVRLYQEDAKLTAFILRLHNTGSLDKLPLRERGMPSARPADVAQSKATKKYLRQLGWVDLLTPTPRDSALDLIEQNQAQQPSIYSIWDFVYSVSDLIPSVEEEYKTEVHDTRLVAKWRNQALHADIQPFSLVENTVVRSFQVPTMPAPLATGL